MKKSKLLVLSLLAVSAIGLTSCGEAGPKGDTGDKGAPGEKGETGAPGKDGVDGKDGTNFLNGEGEPLSSLGKDGDSYLDTLTYDYYVKVSGAWVKKGNIKGEKGEDGEKGPQGDAGEKGEKGDTGSRGDTGTKGDDGDTAWSNLILSSQYATITPDKGSYKENTTATFTVEFSSNLNDLEAFSLLVTNGSETKDLKLKEKVGTKYVYTATMPEGGYVVQADFGSFTSAINKRSNILLVGNVELKDNVTITKETKIDFNGHSINVNGKSIEDQSALELQNSGEKSSTTGEIYDSTTGTNTLLSVNGTKVATEVKNQYSEKNDENAISAFGLNNNLERYADDEESDGKASLTVGKNVSIIANGKGAAIASTGIDSHITIQEDAVVKNTNTAEGKAIEVGGVGEVKIEGTVSSSGGTAVAVTESAAIDKDNKAAITISGSVASTSGTAVEVASASKVTVSGGSVKSESGTAVKVTEDAVKGEEKASVVIEAKDNKKAEVSSTSGTAVEVKAGEVKVEENTTVSGGTSAIKVDSGSVTVSGTVNGGSTSAVEVSGGSVTVAETGKVAAKEKEQTDTSAASAIKVTGGDVTISGSVSGSDNVVEVSNGSVKVEGTKAEVTASAGTAVSTSGDASLEVNSGKVSGATAGISVSGGSVAVSGGTVEVSKQTEESTTASETAAIKIDKNAGEGTKVDLSGGTIQNNNSGGAAISGAGSTNVELDIKQDETTGESSVEIKEKDQAVSGYTVSDKITVNKIGDDKATITPNKKNALVLGENIIYTITPSDGYILSALTVKVGESGKEESYYAKVNDGKVAIPMLEGTVVSAKFEKIPTDKFVFEVGSSKKVYDSFDKAIEAGETDIKLINDTTTSKDITLSNKSLTIDLNGKKLNFEGNNRIYVKDGSNLVLKGSTGSEINVTKNTFNQSFIKIVNEENSKVNKVNIEKNVTINVNADSTSLKDKTVYGLAIFQSDKESSKILTKSDVVVNGIINVDGTGLSVIGNIKSDLGYTSSDNKITLGSTAKVISTFKGTTGKAEGNTIESMAIYQAGLSEVVVNGGEYSAIDSAIEVRNGKLTINGGTFKSTAESFEVKPNGNGKTVTGAALVVDQHTTKGDVEVIVNGGTFTGVKGLYAADVQGNGSEYIKKVSIALNGGTFTSTIDGGTNIDIQDGITCSAAKGADGTIYDTLQDAIDAAKEGSTVTLLRDIYVESCSSENCINITKPLTIEGNGHKIKGNFVKDSDAIINVHDIKSGSLVINDLTIYADNWSGHCRGINIYNTNCEVKLNKTNIYLEHYYAFNILAGCDGMKVSMEECKLKGWSTIYNHSDKVTLNAKNSEFDSVNKEKEGAESNSFTNILVCEYYSKEVESRENNFTFEGCTFTADKEHPEANVTQKVCDLRSPCRNTVSFNNCKFEKLSSPVYIIICTYSNYKGTRSPKVDDDTNKVFIDGKDITNDESVKYLEKYPDE